MCVCTNGGESYGVRLKQQLDLDMISAQTYKHHIYIAKMRILNIILYISVQL